MNNKEEEQTQKKNT